MFELYKFGYLGLTDLRASEDVESATAAFERKFERPAEGSSAKRIAEATIIFNHMVSPLKIFLIIKTQPLLIL